ncbi:MAG: transcriptional repressor [Rhodobacteraceae bacterium]|nr:transcriptional repressor [Paracoccaceae bacterium]
MTAIGFGHHNHAGCIAEAMQAAETLCAEQKLQFTPIRRRVLELLLQDHRALGAYDILEKLAAEGLGAQPPVAYRALDFLVKHGLAHRIERLNAYAACTRPDHDHVPAFLICRACKGVAEAETQLDQGRLGQAAKAAHFTIERIAVEAEGLCPDCAQEAE